MIIWIASYPRSGNTFLRVILKSVFGLDTYSVYDDKAVIGKDAATSDIVGHKMLPDDFDLESARKSQRLYLIKTHGFISNADDKVIYLVRDGRQSALSYLNYMKSFHDESCKIEDVIFGNVPFDSWGDHIEKWKPAKRENTLLLKFEELTRAPDTYLKSIAEFIGVQALDKQIPDFEQLHAINPKFFRQGKSDTWKEELSSETLELFWMNNFFSMQELYPEAPPPEIFGDAVQRAQICKLASDQGKYYRAAIDDLRTQLGDRDKRLKVLVKRVFDLEEKLHGIYAAITKLVDVKAWKSPREKYRLYKNLLDVFLSMTR